MKVNESGMAVIRRFEGCQLTCYKDIVGLLTIGYGHRTELPEGTKITQDEANELLAKDVERTASGIKPYIKLDLSNNQFSACVCLAFNIGVGAFKDSTLLKLINAGGIKSASEQFERWAHAGGKVIPGLLRRRIAERDLFLR